MHSVQRHQLIQNNLLRTLNGTKIKDRVSISYMLDKYKMLSVNQLNASVKLMMMWKALNKDNYPLTIKRQESNPNGMSTRSDSEGRPIEIGKTILVQKTSVSDAIHLWNSSPKNVTESGSIYRAKMEIKIFAKTLPI